MNLLVNITKYEFTSDDIKELIGFLYQDKEKNKLLIRKLMRLDTDIKKSN